MRPQYKLIYFDARQIAEPCRLVFAYAGVEYDDERITSDTWTTRKSNYTWSSLPVLEFEGKVLEQSSAIVRYLGKKFNLAGENDFEEAKCDEFIEAMADLSKATCNELFAAVAADADAAHEEEAKLKIKNEIFPKYLSQFNKAVTTNGGFLVGRRFSYADFYVANFLQIFNEMLGGDLLNNFPGMKSHSDAVFSAKGIKEWIAKRPKTES